MGNNVVTPEDIITALSANGGVNNSVAEMISLYRDTMGLFLKKHSHIIERLAPAKNHTEAQFDIDTMTMTSFQYSGIGSGEKVSLAESAETSPSLHPVMDSDDEDSTNEADCCNGVIMDIKDDDEIYTTYDMSDSLINTMSACIGKVTGCRIYGIENVAKYNPRLSKQKKAVTTLDDIEGSDSDSETEYILCNQCKRTFYSVENKEKHACKGLGSRHNIW
jgi:hypothetical protein